MNRKGQGISINTIIIAAIAILVLIVLAILIARSSTDVSNSRSCIAKGGVCSESCDANRQIGRAGDFCDGNDFCCSPVPVS